MNTTRNQSKARHNIRNWILHPWFIINSRTIMSSSPHWKPIETRTYKKSYNTRKHRYIHTILYLKCVMSSRFTGWNIFWWRILGNFLLGHKINRYKDNIKHTKARRQLKKIGWSFQFCFQIKKIEIQKMPYYFCIYSDRQTIQLPKLQAEHQTSIFIFIRTKTQPHSSTWKQQQSRIPLSEVSYMNHTICKIPFMVLVRNFKNKSFKVIYNSLSS